MSSALPQKSATLAGRNGLRNNGIEEFVEYWETLPLFESQREMGLDEELRPERLANDAESMALCLEGAGKHAMPDASQAFAVVAKHLGTRQSTCGATTTAAAKR